MKLNTSYRQILAISVPIMLGSAAQNIIVLSDNVFLYHVNQTDFGAVGLVGVFYLIIASIGYGFSRGGQILIARRYGEANFISTGNYFKSLLLFEFAMAIVMFCFLYFGSSHFFKLFIDKQIIYEKCLEYIYPRSFGVFFSYLGVSIVALYTGIARTKFIIYDTLILIVVNIALNYIFIFGKFGIEPMGIRGAGLASTIAEVVAFLVFVVYMIFDKQNRLYRFFSFDGFNLKLVKQTWSISAPIVWQSVLGLGSWFIFFALIENSGERQLEISNLLRNVYLILSVPCWGYSAGINTLVSNFIGNRRRQAVIPIIAKTAKLNLYTTLVFAVPIAIFPEFFLYPLFGGDEMTLVDESKALLPLLVVILALFSIGSTIINGLIGTGHTKTALLIQSLFTVFYTVYAYLVIKILALNLHWAWAAEIFYWAGIGAVSYMYLRSGRWHKRKF